MSIKRERSSIKGREAINAGNNRDWLDAGRRAVAVPTRISGGRFGNRFVLAIV